LDQKDSGGSLSAAGDGEGGGGGGGEGSERVGSDLGCALWFV